MRKLLVILGALLIASSAWAGWDQTTGTSDVNNINDLDDVSISSATSGESVVYRAGGFWGNLTISGSGDVSGPSSSLNNGVVVFNGTSGKLVRSGSAVISAGYVDAPVGFKVGGSALSASDVGAAALSHIHSEYQTSGQVDNAIAATGHVTQGQVDNTLAAAGYVTQGEVDNSISASGHVTQGEVDNAIAATGHLTQSQVIALVTFDNLYDNGDIGTGASQAAVGNHAHPGVYEPVDATIVRYDEETTFTALQTFSAGLVTGRSTNPTVVFKSSFCADLDDNAYIQINPTATGSGVENIDIKLSQQRAGTMTPVVVVDADSDMPLKVMNKIVPHDERLLFAATFTEADQLAEADKQFIIANGSGVSWVITRIYVHADKYLSNFVLDEYDFNGVDNNNEIGRFWATATSDSTIFTASYSTVSHATIEATHGIYFDYVAATGSYVGFSAWGYLVD